MIAFFTSARRPADERARQAAVDRSGLVVPAAPERLRPLVEEAARLFDTDAATISIIDGDRQVFPVRTTGDTDETPRAIAICAHAILEPDEVFVLEDASRDERFAANPLVTAARGVRFYAGAPIVDGEGHALGVLCATDSRPRRRPARAVLDRLRALAAEIARIAAE